MEFEHEILLDIVLQETTNCICIRFYIYFIYTYLLYLCRRIFSNFIFDFYFYFVCWGLLNKFESALRVRFKLKTFATLSDSEGGSGRGREKQRLRETERLSEKFKDSQM